MSNKKLTIGLVIVAVIAIIGVFTPSVQKSVSSNLGRIDTAFTNIGGSQLSIGSGCSDSNTSCTGTAINQMNDGTCYIKAYATTIAATTSVGVDCQATAAVSASTGSIGSPLAGVQLGDFVQATLSTTTAGTSYGGLSLLGASASTTAGYIVLRIENLTGTTFTWSTSASATGTASYMTSR